MESGSSFNSTTETVSLLGLTLSDGALDDEATDQITFTREVLIGTGNYLVEPQSYVVFGLNADVETNGGVAVDYAYAGVGLTNSNGALVITNSDGETVDALYWNNGTLTSADGTVLGESLDSAGSPCLNGDGSGECRGSAALGDSDFARLHSEFQLSMFEYRFITVLIVRHFPYAGKMRRKSRHLQRLLTANVRVIHRIWAMVLWR